jgi:hypothetical protein
MDMKPSRFTEEQIIGILRDQEAGAKMAMFAASTGSATYTCHESSLGPLWQHQT